jgi:hypothetical protein
MLLELADELDAEADLIDAEDLSRGMLPTDQPPFDTASVSGASLPSDPLPL